MIFVAVGDDNASYFFLIFPQIGKVRDDNIDARHAGVREGHAAVNNNNFVAVFKYGHVFTDFAHASQRYDAQRICLCCFLFLLTHSLLLINEGRAVLCPAHCSLTIHDNMRANSSVWEYPS